MSLASAGSEGPVCEGGSVGDGGAGEEMMDNSEMLEQLCDDESTEGGEEERGEVVVASGRASVPLLLPGGVIGSEPTGEKLGMWIEGQLAPVLLPLISPARFGSRGGGNLVVCLCYGQRVAPV